MELAPAGLPDTIMRPIMPAPIEDMVFGVVHTLTNRGGCGPHWFPFARSAAAPSKITKTCQIASRVEGEGTANDVPGLLTRSSKDS